MVMTCLTFEAALQDVLQQYQTHQTRLNNWIEELTERASELLLADFVQVKSDGSGSTNARTISGLQVAARHFFATAMQLSKEQMQAAIRLTRLEIFQQQRAGETSHKPLAQAGVSALQTQSVKASESAVSAEEKTACSESVVAAQASAPAPVTPVRAAAHPKPESLVDILAREAEEAMKGLDSQEINRSIREYRRQREKELKQALKG